MEINYVEKDVTASGDGMEETSIVYKGFIDTGINWIDTLANANLAVKVQGKIRDIMRSDAKDKQGLLDTLCNTMPENVIGGSIGFTRNDIDNILTGTFPARLPSPETLIDLFAEGVITSKKEFMEVRKAVNAERKARKKVSK